MARSPILDALIQASTYPQAYRRRGISSPGQALIQMASMEGMPSSSDLFTFWGRPDLASMASDEPTIDDLDYMGGGGPSSTGSETPALSVPSAHPPMAPPWGPGPYTTSPSPYEDIGTPLDDFYPPSRATSESRPPMSSSEYSGFPDFPWFDFELPMGPPEDRSPYEGGALVSPPPSPSSWREPPYEREGSGVPGSPIYTEAEPFGEAPWDSGAGPSGGADVEEPEWWEKLVASDLPDILLDFGAAAMAGESPEAFTNIGRALQYATGRQEGREDTQLRRQLAARQAELEEAKVGLDAMRAESSAAYMAAQATALQRIGIADTYIDSRGRIIGVPDDGGPARVLSPEDIKIVEKGTRDYLKAFNDFYTAKMQDPASSSLPMSTILQEFYETVLGTSAIEGGGYYE